MGGGKKSRPRHLLPIATTTTIGQRSPIRRIGERPRIVLHSVNFVSEPNVTFRMECPTEVVRPRLGEKRRVEKQEQEMQERAQRIASSSYRSPEPEELEDGPDEGLPWGGMSMRHIIAAGLERQKKKADAAKSSAKGKAARWGDRSGYVVSILWCVHTPSLTSKLMNIIGHRSNSHISCVHMTGATSMAIRNPYVVFACCTKRSKSNDTERQSFVAIVWKGM